MNNTFTNMKNDLMQKPLRLKLSFIGTAISAFLMIISIFFPLINFTANVYFRPVDCSNSLWDATVGGIKTITYPTTSSYSSAMNMSPDPVQTMLKLTYGTLLGFMMAMVVIFGIGVVVLKFFDKHIACRIIGVSAAGVTAIMSIVVMVKMSEFVNMVSMAASTSSVYGWSSINIFGSSSYGDLTSAINVSVGFGSILLLLSSLSLAAFTAIGVKYPSAFSYTGGDQRITPPGPPITPPQPTPPEGSDITIKLEQGVSNDPPTNRLIGKIEGIKGQYAGVGFTIRPNEKMIIGRDPAACNIVVNSNIRDISRVHCTIKYDQYGNCYRVEDRSSNGTFANGTPLPKNGSVRLECGTILSLGAGENSFRLT